MLNKKYLIVAIFLLLPSICFSFTKEGTVYTTDGSYSDVNSAITDATIGDTVNLPTGTFGSGQGWTTSLTIQKKIILQGQGMTNTILESTASPVILLNSANASGIRITGIKFNGTSTFISITTPVINFRFDHCHFNHSVNATAISVVYNSFTVPMQGLVDNCRFDRSRFYLTNHSSGTYLNSAVWSNPTNLGGENFLYVEDCEAYNYKTDARPWHFLDGNMAAAYVSRYNKTYGYYHELHGPEHSGGNRGGRKYEIYRNYLFSDFSDITYRNQYETALIRSGTGVIFQNEHLGYSKNWFRFGYYRWTSSRGPAGQCNGSSAYDNNTTGYGWLCLDQCGAGKDESTRTAGNINPYQGTEAIYLWGNTTNGNPNNVVTTSSTNWAFIDHFQADRDIFIEGYGIGISSGLLSARPGTCTTGQGYWATDQGTWNKKPAEQQGILYKCVSANTWSTIGDGITYIPYTYPHPLREEGIDPPPVMAAGSPSGSLSCISNPMNVVMGIHTDLAATCKWSLVNQPYADMPNTFSSTGGTYHSTTLTSLGCLNSYVRYVRCAVGGTPNTESYPISFSIKSPNVLTFGTKPSIGAYQ